MSESKLLQFTGTSGNAVYILSDLIEGISLGINENIPCTIITGASGEQYCIRDSIERVITMLST